MCDIYDDLDCHRLVSEREHRARKLYRCDGCCGPIAPGRRYTRRASVYGDQMVVERLCRPCLLDSTRFAKEHGWAWLNDWLEFLRECVVDDGAAADPRWRCALFRAEARGKQWKAAEAAHA